MLTARLPALKNSWSLGFLSRFDHLSAESTADPVSGLLRDTKTQLIQQGIKANQNRSKPIKAAMVLILLWILWFS